MSLVSVPLILRRQGSELTIDRIRGQLHAALKVLEEGLEALAQNQIEFGRVTIANRFAEFHGRYEFFRSHADRCFSEAQKAPAAEGEFRGFVDAISARLRAGREGIFYSTAMIDAYFSCLEHRLILLRAFSGRPLGLGELTEMLVAN